MFDAKELLNVFTGGQPAPGTAASDLGPALERGKKTAVEVTSAVSAVLDQAQARLQGTEAEEYVRKAKELVDQNPVATFAVLSGLTAVLLGPQASLAAIGIAIKALRNHQEGKPLAQGVPGLKQLTAPEGSSFFEQAHMNAFKPRR